MSQGAPATTSPSASQQAREAETLKQISEVATQAIKSAQADVETVKWIFVAVTTLLGIVGILIGVGGYLGFKSLAEVKEYFKKELASDVQQLTLLRKALGRALVQQDIIDGNHSNLVNLENRRRSLELATPSEPSKKNELAALEEERKATGERILEDLKELQVLLKQIESERWDVWHYGIYGVTLHLLSRYKDAREYLQIACNLARKVHTKDKAPLGSHLYNLACCLAMMEEKEEALTTLDKALATSPWLRIQARADGEATGDFSGLAKDPRFEAILSKYAKT